MTVFSVVSYVYATILLLGGVIGFISKGSVESAVVSASAFAVVAATEYFRAPLLHIVSGGAMLYVMGLRYLETKKFMPAGLVAALSLAFILFTIFRVLFSNNHGKTPDARK